MKAFCCFQNVFEDFFVVFRKVATKGSFAVFRRQRITFFVVFTRVVVMGGNGVL